VRIILTPFQAPNANAYAERFVRSIREECLDRLILFGEQRLQHALDEFVAHYHGERNHQGIDNELIVPGPAPARGHPGSLSQTAGRALALLPPRGLSRGWACGATAGSAKYSDTTRLDEANALGGWAVEFSRGQPGFAAYAAHLLGDIATHPDRFDAERSEAHYRQALALAEPRGMRPLVARCHLGLGKLYRRSGKREQAHEHLTTATTMYREMGMTYWREKAEAERWWSCDESVNGRAGRRALALLAAPLAAEACGGVHSYTPH
jgi:tetratricopeptide (TPR) repeat protein